MIAWVAKLRRRVRSWGDLRLLVAMTVFVASVPLLMKGPLPRALARIDLRRRRLARLSVGREAEVRVYLGALTRLGFWSFRDNCVVASLTRYVFSGAENKDSRLVFGVRSDPASGAPGRRHVWLLVDGLPFEESEDVAEYRELYRHPR